MSLLPSSPRRRTERYASLSSGEPIPTFDRDRRCAALDCDAVLSRYNPRGTCATHGGWQEEKAVRRRRAEA